MKLPLHTATPWTVQRIDADDSGWTACEIVSGERFVATHVCNKDDAEFIVRACNAHEELQRMAELVVSAAKYRRDQEWKLMHLDLSEAAEIALRHTAGVQP